MASPWVALLLTPLLLIGCDQPVKPIIDAGVTAPMSPVLATLGIARGDVQVRHADKPYWQALSSGESLRAGDWVRTAKGAFAHIEFNSGESLDLGEDALIIVEQQPAHEDAGVPLASVEVQSGEVRGELPKKRASAGRLVLKTKEAGDVSLSSDSKEGVKFRITRGAKGSEIAVTEGSAKLHTSSGERALSSGKAATIATGGAIEEFSLIDFPTSVEPGIDARFKFKPGMAVSLVWRSVEGASGYRVQIAEDLSFHSLISDTPIAGTEYTLSPGKEGIYAWRVATKDAQGHYGEFGFARRVFCDREQPKDLLLAPRDGAVIAFSAAKGAVQFSWDAAADAHAYRVVIGRGPNLLETEVLSVESPTQEVEVQDLAPGDYYWGAFIVGPEARPIFLQPRRLSLRKTTKASVKTIKAVKDWGG